MSEDNDLNKNLQSQELPQENTSPEVPDIFNSDFYKSFEPPKKLPEKKTKISNVIKFLKENSTYLQSLKDEKKILPLYDIILTNLIENNNNFVMAQIDLIEILSDQISNSESNEKKNNFINFYKKALPKLFDKFYLQNQKINENLLKMFDNSIKRNNLQLKDYYPLIENICIEEDDEYKTNILNFLYDQINKDENLSIENIPFNIIEAVTKSENTEDNNLNEVSRKIMDVLNNRNIKLGYNENDSLLNIPSTPLSQQDSKLAFSSFIKKISKAVKQENLNKKLNNMKSNFNNTERDNKNLNINNNENEEDALVNIISKKSSIEKIEDLPEENDQSNNNNEEEKNVNENNSNNNNIQLIEENPNKNELEVQNENKEIYSDEINKNENIDEIIPSIKKEESKNEINNNNNIAKTETDFNKNDNIQNDNNYENQNNNINNNNDTEVNYVVEKNNKNNNNTNENQKKFKNHIKRPKSKSGKNLKVDINSNNNENKEIKNNENNQDNLKQVENIKEEEKKQVSETPLQDVENKDDAPEQKIEESSNKIKDEKDNKKNKNEKEKEKENSKKDKDNKKGYKSRITRSRKLGVLAKPSDKDNNKNKQQKNEDNNNQKNDENKEEKTTKISVNINKAKIKEKGKGKEKEKEKENDKIKEKENDKEKEKEIEKENVKEKENIKEKEKEKEKTNIRNDSKEIDSQNQNQPDNKKNIEKKTYDNKLIKESKKNAKNNKNKNNDFTIEILVKTPENNKVQIYNNEENPIETNNNNNENNIPKENPIQEVPKKIDNIQKKKIENFDDIPINTNSNKFMTEMDIDPEQNQLNENEMAPKKISIDEFNKKIELALEQEKQDQLNKDGSDSNMNNKSKKQDKDDPKFDGLKSLLGNEICESLASPKWEMKKHAFELINTFVNENEPHSYSANDLFEYIKIKLKNFKETNFNIIREAMNIYISMIKKRILSKDNFILLINTYYEKIGDIKLKDNIIELINTSIEESVIELSSLISNLITKILKKNNVKILNEYSTLFCKMVEDYDIKDLPVKEMINYCKYMAGNSNPQVRTSATNLICVIYKYVGEDVKILIKDIKESTLKIIEAELEKVTVIERKEQSKKKKIKKNENADGNKKKPAVNLELVGPVDISKKINTQLIKDLSEGKWIEKREACETIEKILVDANMKILPNGLNDLFNLIKTKLSDGNKNLVKILISLVNKFIQSLKKEFKPWTKMIALSLIPNLSDKNQAIKHECQLCFEKWVEHVGIESLVIYFPQFLKNDNVEIRIEIMKFIQKYNDKFTKNIAENVYKELIDGLLMCLQDRSNNVRNEAEEIIQLSLNYINIDTYYKKAKDFKPAIAKDLKQILDNIMENRYLKDDNDNNINNNDNNKNLNLGSLDLTNNNNVNNPLDSPTHRNINIKEKIRNSLKNKKSDNLINVNNNTTNNLSNLPNNNNDNDDKVNNYNSDYMSGDEEPEISQKNTNNIKNINISNVKKKKSVNKTAEKEKIKKSNSKLYEGIENINNINNKGPLSSNSTVLRSNKKGNNSIEKKQKIQRRNTLTKNSKFTSNVFISNNIKLPQNKTKRYELDKKFKFTIDTMTKDDINKLKEISKLVFCEEFYNKILANDFKKQVEALKKMKSNLDQRENISLYFDNLDIILKIIGIKLNSVLNPLLIKTLFLFLDSLYNILNENEYKLNEIESTIILCLLIDKLSLNNNQLKDHLLNLINQYMELLDINKSGLVILNYALNKNNKIKSNVLDMIIELYLNKKINIKSKNYIKVLSKYLLVNDNIVKSRCITIFREIQEIIKEELWNIKDIGEKERNILENNLFNNEENDDENNDNDNDSNEGEDNYDNNNQYDDENYNEEDNEEDENRDEEGGYEQNNFNSDEGDNNYNEEENNDNAFSDNENRYNNEEENEYNNEVMSDNNEDENEKFYLKNDDNLKQKHNNYYVKTDNKVEEKRKIDKYNQKNQMFYKNNDIIAKIQKLQNTKKNIENNLNNNYNNVIKKEKEKEKEKEDINKNQDNKLALPKKIVVKQKKSNNIKKLKNNNNSNANNSKTNNKNLNINSNNINNNYINNNIINNYYNNNNNSMANTDLSISLYNDMNINNNQNNNLINNNFSNSTVSSEKELLEIMNNLFSEDESEKMSTIIIIHEILCSKYQQNKFILIPNIDNIIKIIIQITHELFDCLDNLNNKIIPLKFAKYLVTILCKLTSNKELIIHISYKVLYDLCFELLNYLLINGLDKIGSNQEGNIIFKSLNSAMLRVIENCDTTSVILALLEIIKQNQNNSNSGLLSNLAIKCLLKTTQNIQSIINNIQLDKILLQMHLLTYNFEKISNNLEQNSQSDIMIIRFIKNFIIDIVKIKKTDIMEDYNKSVANSQYKDKYIYSWIKSTLESIGCTMPDENDNNELNEINDDNNNEIGRTGSNNRSTSTNINKNRINNSDKKRDSTGYNFDGNKTVSGNLNKKSAIIVKKHANNSINNRYNNSNNNNIHSSVNNINVTKSSILGSSNITNNNKITIQKNNLKSSQVNKNNVKNKKKFKLNK